MKIKSTIAILLLAGAFITSCSRDKFSGINSDPATVTQGNINYLFTQAELNFEPSGYTYWFYNMPMMAKWAELGIGTGGFTTEYHKPTETGDQGAKTYDVLRYLRDIEDVLSREPAAVAAQYQNQVSALKVLCVYLGIFDTDMFGDMPFTEACMAKYTNPMLLTPKYDKVEDLYDLWLSDLDECITSFTTATDQIFIAKQDIIYGGDVTKWAKLANSLKLKIAVRLISKNKAKALQIAQAVASNAAGVLNGASDDFMFCKGTSETNGDGDKIYHFGNDVLGAYIAPTALVADFMYNNRDPRIRFFFTKNGFNSKVVQAFFDQNVNLPSHIAANVNYTTVAGKKVFQSWKAPGEPWVRYCGLPMVMNASQSAAYDGYFNTTKFTLENATGGKYSYYSFSRYNEEMVRGRVDFGVPVAPNDSPVTDTKDNPWYGMYMSTAEVNLYLAELSLLGASLPQSAQAYYDKGVQASVEEYDNLAKLNQIPYYGTTYGYDSNEKVIDLQGGEIATMMAKPAVQFTGTNAEKLEKVYIQQILHLSYLPSDQFCVVRRSGIPSRTSTIFKWVDFTDPKYDQIPRRFGVTSPSITDIMYDITSAAYSDEGFTTGTTSIDTKLLNSERVWQDGGAPNFGEGPR